MPHRTPMAVLLTFLNCLLFSATLGMIFHEPLMAQRRANLFKTFAKLEPAPTGYYPETSISLIYPEQPIFPGEIKVEAPTTPAPKVAEPKEASSHKESKSTGELLDGVEIEENKVVAILVNGKIKGYTGEYLNSISLLRDFHSGSRIMVMVKGNRVIFSNLDTGEKINGQVISRNLWAERYPDEALQELQVEEVETYQPSL